MRTKTERHVAIAGATGAVGKELIRCLERRSFPLSKLKLLASERSAGKTLTFRGEQLPVETLSDGSFDGIDVALFATDSKLSKQYVPIAVEQGANAIDNSSAYRMDEDVPLIIPEINAHE